MNPIQVNQMQQFCQWVRETANKSANFKISFWDFASSNRSETEFGIWIDGIYHHSTNCLESLVQSIPAMKALCNVHASLQSKEA